MWTIIKAWGPRCLAIADMEFSRRNGAEERICAVSNKGGFYIGSAAVIVYIYFIYCQNAAALSCTICTVDCL